MMLLANNTECLSGWSLNLMVSSERKRSRNPRIRPTAPLMRTTGSRTKNSLFAYA